MLGAKINNSEKSRWISLKFSGRVCLGFTHKTKKAWLIRTDFCDKLFLTTKEHTQKFGKHHRDNCGLLSMIRNFHRSLWGIPKVPLGWDPWNKIENFSNLKKQYKTFIDFIKLEWTILVNKPSTEQNFSNLCWIIWVLRLFEKIRPMGPTPPLRYSPWHFM